ncbi:MAG TPA: nitroreductase family protein [Steroidobacteraceae bacterium]|nr:nitroreductase family protein [Steroidobacteraceae bacterium]
MPRALIEECLRAAGSAPSGANQQPWHFEAVSDPAVKQRIGVAAGEREFYAHRAPPEWLEVLQPLGTNASKPFPETAPWLIAVFIRRFERLPDATKRKHYYMDESVSLATRRSRKAIPSAGRRLPGGRPKGDASLFCCIPFSLEKGKRPL